MDYQSLVQELESLGTAQNRKVYARHGVGENQYGISFGNLRNLQKRIKRDHGLAQKLWA
jgi:3-methyladenine DNA glycosylase AlkD